MSDWIIYTLIGLMLFALVVVITVVLVLVLKREKTPLDNPILINFFSGVCDKRFYGPIKKTFIGKSGRVGIIYTPKDVDLKSEKDVKDETVYIDKDKLVVLSKETASGKRNIFLGFPPSATDLDEELKRTEFGKILMNTIEIKNSINAEISAIKEGSNRKTAHMKTLADGEYLSSRVMETINNMVEDLVKISTSQKENKPTTNYTPPGEK